MTREPLYLVDMGTTRCRVWVRCGEQYLGRAEADVGVRDVARGMSVDELRQRLAALMAQAGQQALRAGAAALPRFGIAAGMITSATGLMEVPHVPAPAGAVALARGMRACSCGDVTLFLIPGVRTATRGTGVDAVLQSDVMRGEEALCVGLLSLEPMRGSGAVLHLGSHWKWIFLDADGHIAGSRTSLTVEMIHAVQSQTLLASSVPQMRPERLDAEWLALGASEYRRSGLSRALFCVRLLELEKQGTGEQRLAFLYGAFLEAELELFKRGDAGKMREMRVLGPAALAAAWRERLVEQGLLVSVVTEEQREEAFLHGLMTVFQAAQQLGIAPVLV